MHQGPKKKKNCFVFDKSIFLKPRRKIKLSTFCSICFRSKNFCSLGPGISQSARTPPKPSKSRTYRKTRVKPPNVVRIRKLRNANAVQMSQKNPGNSPVAPSYGQNSFLWVGFLTDRTGPQLMKWSPAPPPERPYLGSQGYMGPQTGFTGSAFSMRSNLVGGFFAQNGNIQFVCIFGPFGPRAAAKFLQVPQTPQNQ